MYILSDGTETNSKYLYLNDALKLGLSINPYSVPNSSLGIEFKSNKVEDVERLLISNTLKSIDPSFKLSAMEVKKENIDLTISYPYGLVKAEL